jgi:Family of unknown function (DUF5995)
VYVEARRARIVDMGGPRAGLVAAAVALFLAVAPAASADEPPFIDWNPLLPSLAPEYHPSRAKDCVEGSYRCIENTLDEMYRRFDRLYARCDHNAAFGITYIRVTEAIRKAVLARFYEEPRYLNHEDRVFARMYFQSFDAWRAGRRERVPMAWREALDAGRDRSVSGIGNLLMSMNAHINRDMPYLLDALGLTKPDGSSRKPDHDRGNRVLQPLYDDVLRELDARFDDSISNYDVPGLFADDVALFQILQGWRENVWRHAEMLGHAETPDRRKAVADYIEQYALQQARLIKANTTIQDSSARDAHCAAYRRAHRERGGRARPAIGRRGLRASRRGVVRVRVRCDAGIRDCAGAVSITRRGRRLAKDRRVSLGPGRSRVLRMRLGRRTRRVLRRRGRREVRVTVRTASPWGTTRTASRRVRVKRAR